jgi:hypothetical protein
LIEKKTNNGQEFIIYVGKKQIFSENRDKFFFINPSFYPSVCLLVRLSFCVLFPCFNFYSNLPSFWKYETRLLESITRKFEYPKWSWNVRVSSPRCSMMKSLFFSLNLNCSISTICIMNLLELKWDYSVYHLCADYL